MSDNRIVVALGDISTGINRLVARMDALICEVRAQRIGEDVPACPSCGSTDLLDTSTFGGPQSTCRACHHTEKRVTHG